MTRKFLFRAKHKEWDEWVEGDLIHEPSGECIQFVKDGCRSKIKIEPETVCQFTGVYDNTRWEELSEHEQKDFLSEWNFEKDRRNIKEDWNGRKIFENDIIECRRNNQHFQSQVEWDSMCAGFMFQDTKQGSAVGLDALLSCGIYNDFKLIGNIFDNHELIGK